MTGEKYVYSLSLPENSVLEGKVVQHGVTTTIRLRSADQNLRLERSFPLGTYGSQMIFFVSGSGGRYELEIKPKDPTSTSSFFELTVSERHPATPDDFCQFADYVNLPQFFDEVQKFSQTDDPEQLHRALTKLGAGTQLSQRLGDKRAEALFVQESGQVYERLNNFEKALEKYQQAAQIFHDAGDKDTECVALSAVGGIYQYSGRLPEALKTYHQMLELSRKIGIRFHEATCLGNIGAVHKLAGEQQTAIEYFEKALVIQREVKDQASELLILSDLGHTYFQMGNPQKAIEILTQAHDLAQSRQVDREIVRAFNDLAATYDALGEYETAIGYYSKALEMAHKNKFIHSEANLANNLGYVYLMIRDYAKGSEILKQAIQLSHEYGYQYIEASSLTTLGVIYRRMGDLPQALSHYLQALELHKKISNPIIQASTLNNIGRLYHLTKEFSKAEEAHQSALRLGQQTGDTETQIRSLGSLGSLQKDLRQLLAAKTTFEEGIRLVELLRQNTASPQTRAAYFATVQALYGSYIEVLVQLDQEHPQADYARLAFQMAEGSRARSFVELLRENQLGLRQGVRPELLTEEQKLQRQLSEKFITLRKLTSTNQPADKISAGEKEVQDCLNQLDQVQTKIRTENPKYSSVFQSKPLSVEEIQQQILDPDTVLLEYLLGEKQSYLWVVSQTTIKTYQLPGRTTIEPVARRVYDALSANPAAETSSSPSAQSAIGEAAQALSQMILAPAAAELEGKRLIVVSDGILQYIPLGVLPIAPAAGESQTVPASLVTTNEILYLPSISAVPVLRKEGDHRKLASKKLAVFADPVFTSTDSRLKKELAQTKKNPPEQVVASASKHQVLRDFPGDTSLGRLPFSRREAIDITTGLSPKDFKLALDFETSRDTALHLPFDQYQVIHFATHGLLNSQNPELSGIVLSLVNEKGTDVDGFLRVSDLVNLKIPVELVVLSACRTGLGKEVRGEGLVGLTRAFMYAGASRVVASLWKVDDKATAVFMKEFYRAMFQNHQRPVAALRTAQLTLMKNPRFRSPFYWAAFTLQGEWR
ncbi:MAG: CHAT domain-containing protein [Acidobacteria bacterium]|nr:CHAT domain-containing protein [Acidobacteriota bacterium]